MPVIYSSPSGATDDGRVYKYGAPSWAGARDATSGTVQLASLLSTQFTWISRFGTRGGEIGRAHV